MEGEDLKGIAMVGGDDGGGVKATDWALAIMLALMLSGIGGWGCDHEVEKLKLEVAELKGKVSVIEHKV